MWQRMLQGGSNETLVVRRIIPVMTNWTTDGFTVPNVSGEYYGSYYPYYAFGNSSHWHTSTTKDSSRADIYFPSDVDLTYIDNITFNTAYMGTKNNCKIKIETLDSNKQPIQTLFDERVTETSVKITPAQYFNKFNGLRITIYSKTSVSNGFGINNFQLYAL